MNLKIKYLAYIKMKSPYKAQDLLNEWENTKNEKYIHKHLPFDKDIEIDIDGTIYAHIKFPFIKLQFNILKSYFDSVFVRTYETDDSFEYQEGQLLLSQYKGKTYLSYKLSKAFLQSFLDWMPNIIQVCTFIKATI